MAPEFKTIHSLDAALPLECIAVLSASFVSSRFTAMYRLPRYGQWLSTTDLRPAYAYHRRFLQHLQWGSRGQRWVLKAPDHVFGLDALLTTYPDARLIHTHRDPRVVLGSVASLHVALRSAFSDDVDRFEIGREVTQRWLAGFQRAVEFRASQRIPSSRCLDVQFAELAADPLAVIDRVYAQLDMPLSPEVRARMTRFLASNPRGKHGKHRYSLARFGIDAGEVERQCRAYRHTFGVPGEPSAGSAG